MFEWLRRVGRRGPKHTEPTGSSAGDPASGADSAHSPEDDLRAPIAKVDEALWRDDLSEDEIRRHAELDRLLHQTEPQSPSEELGETSPPEPEDPVPGTGAPDQPLTRDDVPEALKEQFETLRDVYYGAADENGVEALVDYMRGLAGEPAEGPAESVESTGSTDPGMPAEPQELTAPESTVEALGPAELQDPEAPAVPGEPDEPANDPAVEQDDANPLLDPDRQITEADVDALVALVRSGDLTVSEFDDLMDPLGIEVVICGPIAEKPAVADPVDSVAEAEPAELESGQAEPAELEAGQAEPAELESGQAEPAELEAGQEEPAELESAQEKPAELESAQEDPAEEPSETYAPEASPEVVGYDAESVAAHISQWLLENPGSDLVDAMERLGLLDSEVPAPPADEFQLEPGTPEEEPAEIESPEEDPAEIEAPQEDPAEVEEPQEEPAEIEAPQEELAEVDDFDDDPFDGP